MTRKENPRQGRPEAMLLTQTTRESSLTSWTILANPVASRLTFPLGHPSNHHQVPHVDRLRALLVARHQVPQGYRTPERPWGHLLAHLGMTMQWSQQEQPCPCLSH